MERSEREQRARAGIYRAYRSVALQGCLYPDCDTGDPVINAHSIQQSRVLESIARGGHIYTFKPQPKGDILTRVGVRKATTFTGFCKHHDNELFASVDFGDAQIFAPQSVRQVVTLSLRSISCEYWKKLNAQRIHSKLLELARNKDVDAVANWLNIERDDAVNFVEFADRMSLPILIGTEDAIRRMGRMVLSLFSQLESGKYHLSKTEVVAVTSPPAIAASAQFPLDYDLMGKQLTSRKMGIDLPEVALNVIPVEETTYFLFLWHRRFDRVFAPIFKDLGELNELDMRVVLSKMLVMHSENVAISPSIVEAWSEEQRSAVEKLFLETMYHARPYHAVPDIDFFGEWTC